MSPSNRCKECGTAIPADSAGGWCPQCLFGLALKGAAVGTEEELAEETREPKAAAARANEKGNILNARLTEQPGDRIGRYRLLQEIGHGGCGVVYMAEQEEPIRRKVALKVIKLGMDTRQVVARFEAERQALALMDHPNIAKVFDAGATDAGRPYFVMELVGGIKITDYCDEHNLTTRQRLDLFIQVCQAIQHAHQKGIIHRDLKPSNVLVATHDGVAVPKIIDFGIAKATQGRLTDQTLFTAFEQFIGTPAYMSPEQAQIGGLDVDTRSDIYSLGVLLYELLTGKIPFDSQKMLAGGLDEIRRTIRETEPSRPSTCLDTMERAELNRAAQQRQVDPPKLIHLLRGDLDWIVMKCLEKDRARRYETANGLARDIERDLNNEPVLASPPSRIYSLQKLYRRNKLVFAAGLVVFIVVLLGACGVLWQWRQARQHARQEHKERERAEQATERALTTLSQMEAIEVRRAEEYYEAGDRRSMLPYLALVLRQNPSNRVAAERLFSTLSHRNWGRLACPPLVHSNRVTSAMFSRDGRWVVTSAADNTAWIWEADTGQRLAGPLTHQAEVNTAEFSPNGQLVVTAADDNTARVWDSGTGRPVTGPILHPARLELARFSPDGRSFVTLCDDGAARLWDAQSGRIIHAPLRHGNGPPLYRFFKEADFSPNGALLATASGEKGALRVWDCRTGETTHVLEHGASETTCVRFSPDGRRLAASFNTNSAVIWDLAANPPRSVSLSREGGVLSIEFSPEGQRVVTASYDGTAQVWDATTGEPIGPALHQSDRVRCATFSPEGLRVITASSDKTIRVWDAETGEPLSEPIQLENGAYYAQFHPDGERALTVSNGKAVLIWWVSGCSSLALHEPFAISRVLFSADSKKMLVGGTAGQLQIQEIFSTQPPAVLPQLDGYIWSLAFSADGEYAVAGSGYGTARVWALSASQSAGKLLKVGDRGSAVLAQFSPDSARVLTAALFGTARLWDARSGEAASPLLAEGDGVRTLEISPDGKWVVTGGTNGMARIWESGTGRPVGASMRHGGQVLDVHFSPDSKRVLTGSADKTTRLWAVPSGEPLSAPIPHSLPLWNVRFSPEGTRFLTLVEDRPSVRIWDSATTQLLTEVFAEQASVADFSPDGLRIILRFTSGMCQFWDSRSGGRLGEPVGQGPSCLSRDGRLLASVSGNIIRLRETATPTLPVPAWLPALAEALAGQRFNQQGLLEPVLPMDLWVVQEKMAAWISANKRVPDAMWIRWAKWFLSSPDSRPVFPSVTRTISQHAQTLAEQRVTPAAAREALLLAPTNLAAMQAVALTTTNVLLADLLSRRSLEKAPTLVGPVWAREALLKRDGRFQEAIELLDRNPKVWVLNPWIWGDKGDALEKLGLLNDALPAYTEAISLARISSANTPAPERALRAQLLESVLRKRYILLKRLSRPAEAQADLLNLIHIPLRASLPVGSRFNPIDLRAHFNQALGVVGLTRTMAGTNDAAAILRLGGVEFELAGCIWLNKEDDVPVLDIPVGQQCSSLHFLHNCARYGNCPDGTVLGAYVVHYDGGGQEEIPIVYGRNVRDWVDVDDKLDQASPAWTGANDKGVCLRLVKCSWRNPHPQTQVQSIDLIPKTPAAYPVVFAITAER